MSIHTEIKTGKNLCSYIHNIHSLINCNLVSVVRIRVGPIGPIAQLVRAKVLKHQTANLAMEIVSPTFKGSRLMVHGIIGSSTLKSVSVKIVRLILRAIRWNDLAQVIISYFESRNLQGFLYGMD